MLGILSGIQFAIKQAIRNIERATSGAGGFRKGGRGRGLSGPTEKDMRLLIKMMDSSNPKWCERSHANLVVLTGVDFKYDAAAWRKWYEENKQLERKAWMLAAMKNAGFAVDEADLQKSAPVFLEAMANPNPGVRAAGYFLIRLATGEAHEFSVLGSEKTRGRQLALWQKAAGKNSEK